MSIGAPVALNMLAPDATPGAADLIPILPSPFTGNLQYTTIPALALSFGANQSDVYGNLVIGTAACLVPPTTGSPVTAIGTNALTDATGTALTALGDLAGQHVTTAKSSVYVGHKTGFYAGSQSSNTFVGAFAAVGIAADPLRITSTFVGGNNCAFGEAAMQNICGFADSNSGIGFNVIFSALYAQSNSAVGTGALELTVNGKQNSALGVGAGKFVQGDQGVFIGALSGYGLTTFHVFPSAAAIGTFVIPLADTSWAILNAAIYAGTFFQAQCTITAKTGTTVTVSNNAFAASVLPGAALVNSRTGLSWYPSNFISSGGTKWPFADTSVFLVGDTVTSTAFAGNATVSSIDPNTSITISVPTTGLVAAGTIFQDKTGTYTAVPSSVTNALSNVFTFANGTAWATVGDVVSVPGVVFDCATILAINPNVSITISQPLLKAIAPNAVAGIYQVNNANTGLGNVTIGYSSGGTLQGGAARNTTLGYNNANSLTTGSNNIIIGQLADIADGTASNQTVIGLGQTAAKISGSLFSAVSRATLANAAGQTWTTAQIAPGVLTRSGAAGVSDTTPTAAQIVAAIPGCEVGSGYEFSVINNNSGTLTIVAGAGVTLAGTTTIATLQMRRYLVRVNAFAAGSEAVILHGIFTAAP